MTSGLGLRHVVSAIVGLVLAVVFVAVHDAWDDGLRDGLVSFLMPPTWPEFYDYYIRGWEPPWWVTALFWLFCLLVVLRVLSLTFTVDRGKLRLTPPGEHWAVALTVAALAAGLWIAPVDAGLVVALLVALALFWLLGLRFADRLTSMRGRLIGFAVVSLIFAVLCAAIVYRAGGALYWLPLAPLPAAVLLYGLGVGLMGLAWRRGRQGRGIVHREYRPRPPPNAAPLSSDDPTAEAVELLGLKPGFTQAELRTRYRELSKKLHPDTGGSAALFRQIQLAYEHLKRRP